MISYIYIYDLLAVSFEGCWGGISSTICLYINIFIYICVFLFCYIYNEFFLDTHSFSTWDVDGTTNIMLFDVKYCYCCCSCCLTC